MSYETLPPLILPVSKPQGNADVRERMKILQMEPTKDVLRSELGSAAKYEEKPDGEWCIRITNNERGVVTKAAKTVWDLFKPSVAAQMERQQRFQSYVPNAVVLDREGRKQIVAEHLVESLKDSNGYIPIVHVGGRRVVAGPDGMLWRRFRGEWEPTGKLQVGLNGKRCPTRRPQLDPDWHLWEFSRGKRRWVRADGESGVGGEGAGQVQTS